MKELEREYLLIGLGCASCGTKIEERLSRMPEIREVRLDFVHRRLHLQLAGLQGDFPLLEAIQRIADSVEPGIKVTEPATQGQEKLEEGSSWLLLGRVGLALAVFFAALLLPLGDLTRLMLYVVSYLLAGGDVLWRALRDIFRGQLFDENFLMSLATIGAFAIGEYPEGAAVMLFYQVGEFFQDQAVDHSRRSISALLDIRPDYANLKTTAGVERVAPEVVQPGELILVKPGERVPLDGLVVEGISSLDLSALTGESSPRDVIPGDQVLSGAVNHQGVLTLQVERVYAQSTVARILDLVENAAGRKAPTESFITRFARYYTPAVVMAALALAFVPPLFLPQAELADWVRRALVFLVVSCPCALVISIPLGFFGGIGAASRHGILVKGGNFLEALNWTDTVVFDKTGTLTKGEFALQEVVPADGFAPDELLLYGTVAEHYSSHPIALSIKRAGAESKIRGEEITDYQELPGHGVIARYQGKRILAGNAAHLTAAGISYPIAPAGGTVIYVAVDQIYAGFFRVADQLKDDAKAAIDSLRQVGVRRIVMLTGDEASIAAGVAETLGIKEWYGGLLPEDKVARLEDMEQETTRGRKLVFVGDGINDAPVLARADVGIAMGGLGSDAAIEAADIVLMQDEPGQVAKAIQLAKKTKEIVWQNIYFALGVKGVVLLMGSLGVATMWEAVFADVGVALLAVLNALRVLRQ